MTRRPFWCGNCGGEVAYRSAAGVMWLVDRIDHQLPASTFIMRCGQCGETYTNPDDDRRLDALCRGRASGTSAEDDCA